MASWSCAEFLEHFVLPMVAGGEMHVGKPIDVKKLKDYEHALGEASVPLVAIDEARETVLSELVVSPPPLVFDVDELHLAAAVHNLLYLVHPDADGFGAQSARTKVIATAQHFAARTRTGNRRRLMARHALLHNLFDIGRVDLKISWWTGSVTLLGQPAPGRLMRWRDLRRVKETETQVGFADLFKGADVAAVLAALVRRSPLSQLLYAGKDGPHLHWEDAVFLLRDSELARSIAYNAIRGSDPHARLAIPARFAASFEQMLERSPSESDVRTVAAFLVYLNCLLALDEVGLREKSPLLAAALGTGQRPRGLATFFALPAALSQVDARLYVPDGLLTEDRLAGRWEMHREQALEALGESLVDGLAERLRRHLASVLESPALQEDGTASA
jgi:hypothetical protein